MKKYELIKEDSVKESGRTLYRIRALRSFSHVKEGDLGGYIESEANLSHEGVCWVFGNAEVASKGDYIVFKNWWSSGRHFTWTRSNNMWCVGCFYGTGEELIAKAYKDSPVSGREYERVVQYVESILEEERMREESRQ